MPCIVFFKKKNSRNYYKIDATGIYDNHLKDYWTSRIVRLAVYSKKARFLSPQAYAIGKSHPVIRYASRHVKEIPKHNIKLQLMIGTFKL